MNGISDREIATTAYKLGLADGRAALIKELLGVTSSTTSPELDSLRNNAYRRLLSITELGLSGPAHDVMTAKGIVFACQLADMTQKQFIRDFPFVNSGAALKEFQSALEAKGLAFKSED